MIFLQGLCLSLFYRLNFVQQLKICQNFSCYYYLQLFLLRYKLIHHLLVVLMNFVYLFVQLFFLHHLLLCVFQKFKEVKREATLLTIGHFSIMGVCACVCTELLQLCPTLCNPTDHSLPSSLVHGILQARILEWIAIHSLLQGIFLIQGSKLRLVCLLL